MIPATDAETCSTEHPPTQARVIRPFFGGSQRPANTVTTKVAVSVSGLVRELLVLLILFCC